MNETVPDKASAALRENLRAVPEFGARLSRLTNSGAGGCQLSTLALAFDARPGKSFIQRTPSGQSRVSRGRGRGMCVRDAAARKAAVARFFREYPQMEQAECDHPALLGCADVAWSQIPGCPACHARC